MTGGESRPGTPRPRRISLVRTAVGESVRESRPAFFLDRDGTIIRDAGYINDPAAVALVPGAAQALRLAHNRQWAVIVVTNQSGIARGIVSPEQYEAVRARMNEVLAEYGAFVDGDYHCPHHPDITGPCDCRKPGLALYEKAMLEHGIDAEASVFIGDRWRDIEPATAYDARGILVPSAATPDEERERARAEMSVAPSLLAAIESVLEVAS